MNMFRFLFLFLLFLTTVNASKVTLQLQWKHQFQFAGYYIAKEKGFYKEVGLDVTLKEHDKNTNVIDDVLSGKVQYATGRSSLIMKRANGKKVVLLSAILQSSPLALVTKKSSGINSVEKFKNKRFSQTSTEVYSSLYPMLLSHNIDKNSVKVGTSSSKVADLLEDKTDIITLYSSNQEYYLQQHNIKYNIFYPKDFGFDFYSDLLFTNETESTLHTSRTKDFTNASLRGWRYAFDHIEETVDLILKKYNTQNKTKDELLYEGYVLKKLAYANNKNLGDIDRNKVERINDIYHLMGLTDSTIDYDKFIFDLKGTNLYFTQEEQLYLKEHKVIKMCNNNNWEPITFADPNSEDKTKLYGIAIDTLHLIEKKLNVKFEHVPTKNWHEAQEFFKAKKCEILPTAVKTKQREKYANFTQPFLKLPLAIFTPKNKSLVNGLEELKDKIWSRQKGSGLINRIKKIYPETKVVETNNIKESLELVNNKEVDYTIATLPVASHIISQYQFNNIQISGYANIIYDLAIGVQKDNEILLNILDKTLSQITPKQHNAILKSWSKVQIEHPYFNQSFIIQVVLAILIIALFIGYRQYVLKKSNEKLKVLVDEKTKELQELNASLEQKIEQALDEKREQDKVLNTQLKMVSLGEMIGNIAHQWRQPLSVISTGVTGMQIQKQYGLLDDVQFNKACSVINENAQYLSRTIDDFKNFIQGNREKKHFNLENTIETFLHLVEGSIKSHNIDVQIKIDAKLEIYGYENELIQCFINIFNNAKDALAQNHVVNKLFLIHIFIKHNKLCIEFQDNAGGIDNSIIDKIFDPYFTTKHKSQGTGLGLHMSYRLIVEGMNGTIIAKNKKLTHNENSYKGALFTICLPLD